MCWNADYERQRLRALGSAFHAMTPAAALDRAAELLICARRVLVITGAGVSADSGLPTYRGIGGLYEDAATEEGVPIEVALSGQMLRQRPHLTWKYLLQIEAACRGAQPNAGHLALARMSTHFRAFTVLTQNVDGLHRQAGQPQLIEIHGNLHHLVCGECAHQWQVEDYDGLQAPPRCQDCHGPVRPQVVLFGEMLPAAALQQLEAALDQGVDLVLSIGTSSGFPYIAGPVVQAARMGVPTVEINPGRTEVSAVVEVHVPERAAVTLPQLLRRLEGSRP